MSGQKTEEAVRRHSEMLTSWHEAPSTEVACVLYGQVVPEVSTLSGQQEGTGIDSASQAGQISLETQMFS